MQSVLITTKVESLNSIHGEVYWIQHYVIKFVSDLRQVCGFLQVPFFPTLIKLTTLIELKYCSFNGRSRL
jgi:DNA relaxase NicK